jgi:hypothetical protein
MIDWDQQLGGYADDEARDTDAPAIGGLIVAEKAKHGNDLVLESQAFVDSTRGYPLVAFIETADDDPSVEVFGNAAEYMRAFDLLVPPTVEQAQALENQRIAERLEAWRERLTEAGLWPL